MPSSLDFARDDDNGTTPDVAQNMPLCIELTVFTSCRAESRHDRIKLPGHDATTRTRPFGTASGRLPPTTRYGLTACGGVKAPFGPLTCCRLRCVSKAQGGCAKSLETVRSSAGGGCLPRAAGPNALEKTDFYHSLIKVLTHAAITPTRNPDLARRQKDTPPSVSGRRC